MKVQSGAWQDKIWSALTVFPAVELDEETEDIKLVDDSSEEREVEEPLVQEEETSRNEGEEENEAAKDKDSLEEFEDAVEMALDKVGEDLRQLPEHLGQYWVTVGDWLVSATEGADSHPPSEGEEEGADGKAGFASGLMSNFTGVSGKASAGAKTVGAFFSSAFSRAGASVKEAGSKLKETVEKNTLLSEFNKEQEAFIAAKGGKTGETLPPWVGYPDEENLKEEILALSTDRRNFVRSPPSGVKFEFDLEAFSAVAQATLAQDPNLEKMRFELVPKNINEETFWRNYFYRVGLIRQSTALASLEKEQPGDSSRPAAAPGDKGSKGKDDEADHSDSPAHEANEFVSDSFQPSSSDVEEMKRGVTNLGVGGKSSDEDWEAALKEELGEYEVVNNPGNSQAQDDKWEEEIQNLIDDEDSADLR